MKFNVRFINIYFVSYKITYLTHLPKQPRMQTQKIILKIKKGTKYMNCNRIKGL
jgi:hypothetical protein